MKITATQYAKTLYEITKAKSQEEIDSVMKNFAQILRKNGQLKLEKDIAKKFGEIFNRKNGIVEAEVTSREALSGELRNYVSNYVSKHYGAKEVVLIEKIDSGIKGGVIVKVGDEVLDGSVGNQLRKLKNILES